MANAYGDYEWSLSADLREYDGQWVAILDQRVVANGKQADTVLREVKHAHPNDEPLLLKVRSHLSVL